MAEGLALTVGEPVGDAVAMGVELVLAEALAVDAGVCVATGEPLTVFVALRVDAGDIDCDGAGVPP